MQPANAFDLSLHCKRKPEKKFLMIVLRSYELGGLKLFPSFTMSFNLFSRRGGDWGNRSEKRVWTW